MNKNSLKVTTRYGPQSRFEVRPVPPAPFRAVQENELERIKNQLLREQLTKAVEPDLNVRLRRAAKDAAAEAWLNYVPLLVFPALFEEKAQSAKIQAARQASIFERSRALLAA